MSDNILPVTYTLTFFEPDSERENVEYVSTTPFQAVSVGDEVLGITWRDSAYPTRGEDYHSPIALVTRVQRAVQSFAGRTFDSTLVYSKTNKGA